MDAFSAHLPIFRNRREAGEMLAEAVAALPGLRDPVVLALPRGGVPVASEVARRIHAPLDVIIVRKLGTPGQEELALGAVASGGSEYLNAELIAELRLPQPVLARIRRREMAEVERRTSSYRGNLPWPVLRGRSAIVVDDGAATGATALAAIAAIRRHLPAEVVIALPVAPQETCAHLRAAADRLVCLRLPDQFLSIGTWYLDFEQVSDEDVRALLRRALATSRSDSMPAGR